MRTIRGVLIFVTLIALIALTMSPAADLVPFDLLAPVFFVVAAIVIFESSLAEADSRPHAAPFQPATALRGPPLQ